MVLSLSNSEIEKNLPPGFRFHPTDEELVTYYLSSKVSDVNFTTRAVADVDLNKCEPWDLPGKASMGEKEWYFFSMRDRKYPTGLRTNRATTAGYWKTTGKDKEIYHSGVLVGMKKTLVFYKGRAPKGEKSNWVMHEYRLHTKFGFKPSKEEWVICRIFQKSATGKKPQPSPPSMPHLLSSQSDPAVVNDLGDFSITNLNNLVTSSNGFNTISTNNNSENAQMNMSMNMNWAYTNPSSSNYSSNSGLLRAIQFNSYQPAAEAANASLTSFMTQVDSCFVPNSNASFPAGSSKTIDYPEQTPFNLESFW